MVACKSLFQFLFRRADDRARFVRLVYLIVLVLILLISLLALAFDAATLVVAIDMIFFVVSAAILWLALERSERALAQARRELLERQRAEEQLVRQEEQLQNAQNALVRQYVFMRHIIDSDPSYISVRDRDGRYVLANQTLANVLGVSVDQVIVKTLAELHAPPTAEQFHKEDLVVMDSLQEILIPLEQYVNRAGVQRWHRVIKRPIIDPDGRARQMLAIITDLTERKHAEDLLLLNEARFRALI